MPYQNLLRSLSFLENLIRHRISQDLPQKEGQPQVPGELQPPIFSQEEGSTFTEFVLSQNLSVDELVVLLLALTPHIYPHFLNSIVSEYLPEGGDYPAFGGVKGTNHRGTIPTGETALYILAGHDLTRRFEVQLFFTEDHFFAQQNILHLETVKHGEPAMSGRLLLDDDYIDLFTIGKRNIPKLSTKFPAQQISTKMSWNDLVLHPHTHAQIRDLETWIKHNETLMYGWNMHNKLKPGYRALFYGPPGTGKTLTATLLGKYTEREVFRIDLSMVVSKYIGETEKNLSTLFDKARNKGWILFFDEADAIFGKRTNVRDAHDKYANQEVSYLLQQVEQYDGLTILASNFRDNIDDAFTRRFNAIIYFPKPKPAERLKLWEKAFPAEVSVQNIDWNHIAQKYDLTGSHIMNIVHYTCLQLLEKQTNVLDSHILVKSIRKEMAKEGKAS